jgi:hypothetical protein
MPAEVTAKIEDFPIVVIVERGGFIHGHSTKGVLGRGFRFAHGRVSFGVVITPAAVVNAGSVPGNLADHDHRQRRLPHFSTAVYNIKANPGLRIFQGRNRDGMRRRDARAPEPGRVSTRHHDAAGRT